jgi:hypothetical protein
MIIDGVKITLIGEEIPEEEIREYIKRGREQYGSNLKGMELRPDGEEITIIYDIPPVRFNRLRRITGYLVGTLDRFNNAKRAEERDRVKHDTEE